jgi:hypothetical protein
LTHGLRTFSLRQKAGCLQERCCHLAERAKARCRQGSPVPGRAAAPRRGAPSIRIDRLQLPFGGLNLSY